MNTNLNRCFFVCLLCGWTTAFTTVAPLFAEEPRPATIEESKLLEAAIPTGALTSVMLAYDPASTTRVWFAMGMQTDLLIGVDLTSVGDVLRSHLGLGEGKGLVVTAVTEDGPAAKAGIQKNDVLITVGGEEITGLDAFRTTLEAAAEKAVSIGVMRAGKKQVVEVTPRSTAALALVNAASGAIVEQKYWLGVGLSVADDTLRSQLSVPAGEGLVVTSIESESPAAKAGVMVNDVLLKLDGKVLTTIEALTEQLQAVTDKSVLLELLRRGKPATLSVTPEKRASTWEADVHIMTTEPHADLDLIYFAPQRLEALALGQVLTSEPLQVTYSQPDQDVVKQLGDVEVQVKQLEASLTALRRAIEARVQPAPSADEQK